MAGVKSPATFFQIYLFTIKTELTFTYHQNQKFDIGGFYFCFIRKVLLVFFAIIFICANVKEGDKNVENKEKSSVEILVIDASTEEPITAAKVNIDKRTHEAYTDFDGIAKFTDVEIGINDVEISFISYKKHELKAFKLGKNNNKLIVKLQP